MNERIVIDPQIQHGKPVIRGTRVPVARVIGSLAGGMNPEDICQDGLHTTLVQKLSLTYYTHNLLIA